MNIHHLELFYYVAKHGGIMEAVRKMPYGIQQPAVSGQIIQLEDNLGVKLFQRRPFILSPAGQRLFDSIRPFFDSIDGICDQIRDGTSELIRLGAPTMVLDRHFPDIVRELHKTLPGVKVALKEGHHHQIQHLLSSNEIDIAITPIENPSLPGLDRIDLLDIQVCLLVPASSSIQSASHFWEQDRISEPLISLPQDELITKRFNAFLEKSNLIWPPLIELSSLDLIERYVAAGIGIGVGIQNLSIAPLPGVDRIPITEIETITVGVLWNRKLSPAGQHVLELCQKKAKDLKERKKS